MPVAVTSIFVLGTIVCSAIWTQAFIRARGQEAIVRVVGSARRQIRSDFIIWDGSVDKTAPTVAQAFASVKSKMAMTRAYLVGKGVPDKDIVSQGVSVETLYVQPRTTTLPNGTVTTEASSGTQVAGYKLTQSLEVHSDKVDIVDAATRDTSDLLNKGVVLSAQAPTYLYTKMSELKVAMQAEAAKDALNRAQAMASNAGCRLGDVRYVRMQTPSITPYYDKSEDDGGIDDTSAIDKKIVAIVVVGYLVK
ncbi:hypothetical protein IAD21_04380 [Abditibacteriota bacterium]|nr:hypothetical protein IAD21_04380 [Abditibacteriota bacterium]